MIDEPTFDGLGATEDLLDFFAVAFFSDDNTTTVTHAEDYLVEQGLRHGEAGRDWPNQIKGP